MGRYRAWQITSRLRRPRCCSSWATALAAASTESRALSTRYRARVLAGSCGSTSVISTWGSSTSGQTRSRNAANGFWTFQNRPMPTRVNSV
ncbi:hypothetical protein D3C77_564790 [compost metagenome]